MEKQDYKTPQAEELRLAKRLQLLATLSTIGEVDDFEDGGELM